MKRKNEIKDPNQGFCEVLQNKESGDLMPIYKDGKGAILCYTTSPSDFVFEAQYCPCIHESSYATLSIHRTKEGATQAVIDSMVEEFESYKELMKGDNRNFWTLKKFGEHEDWEVRETKIDD